MPLLCGKPPQGNMQSKASECLMDILLLKWNYQGAKWRYPTSTPFTPSSSSYRMIEVTLNEFHVSNLNWWQLFPCHNIHVYKFYIHWMLTHSYNFLCYYSTVSYKPIIWNISRKYFQIWLLCNKQGWQHPVKKYMAAALGPLACLASGTRLPSNIT